MSTFRNARRVIIRRLKEGQRVPCDGRIYCDASGQLWFGIRHAIRGPKDYVLLLACMAALKRGRKK